MKKVVAEFFGTMCLVFMGCGTAMLVGCSSAHGSGYLMTALAFGLSIVAMAYCIGNISGCHINPAVSLAVLLRRGITFGEFIGYAVAQIFGAFAGIGALYFIFTTGGVKDMTGGYGANGLAGVGGNPIVGFVVELILTFFFVMTILGVTSKKANHGSFGGLIIGLTLTFVHIFGIGLTGTSVNPARSIAPAVVNYVLGAEGALSGLWVFIAGPFAGAIIAAVVYSILESGSEPVSENESAAEDE
ncbi:MAG: aquaporin [Lachnospiraceae bacterium]|nr:aquaporin [Lachnospiraceae bacterium]